PPLLIKPGTGLFHGVAGLDAIQTQFVLVRHGRISLFTVWVANYGRLAPLLLLRSSASTMVVLLVGRTRRNSSSPSCRRIKVGQSLTRNERPRARPGPSSIFKWRISRSAIAAARGPCAARQWPHQSVPNSSRVRPGNVSTSARVGA